MPILDPEYVTVNELARRLEMSERHVLRHIVPKLPVLKVGRLKRYRWSGLASIESPPESVAIPFDHAERGLSLVAMLKEQVRTMNLKEKARAMNRR